MTERNRTMMQFFEWHLANDGDHWNRLAMLAPELKKHGIDSVWIPPAAKAITQADNGYGIYDGYDLGEFDQKGTVRTKYGTKDELLKGIDACHEEGISVYADVVMNHKAGADETEIFHVIEVHPDNRYEEISDPFEIEGWTRFHFPGRQGEYSAFTWHFYHFNGTDYNDAEDETGVYRILGDHKHWNEQVDDEFGNYDYLMFANIDYYHPEVRDEMMYWGKWFAETTRADGYRLDAIKHINHEFIADFVAEMREEFGDDFYLVGEFWNPDLEACQNYLDIVDYQIDLFDVPLHYNFHEASHAGRDYDLSRIFENTLVGTHPDHAVTFVDNHDSQPHEALESWVEDWFKPLAYALILLRLDGFPCVFYGDYVGINGDHPIAGKKELLDPLMDARYRYAYGEQHDYFDHGNTIGWVRLGDLDIPGSGCAVVLSNGDDGHKEMFTGEHRAGEVWTDMTGNIPDAVHIDSEGYGDFPVIGGTVSVFIKQD
ncbi:alpha-amylase [Salipaludibacillus aurantiacus]|uniref:Alpha-amylase n=1 Tax=Salipaludibacillus aurantiacus TaxID=1601833 RepID=A0A1H9X1Y2_9BACI|nr:alpha-amylase [Salipaludibacillus aurantiacus]SES40202.1 alpha-amylase [Salipaludibacillus aurantiacus]